MERSRWTDEVQYGFVCIVTGATQAIGKAIVHELAGMRPFFTVIELDND